MLRSIVDVGSNEDDNYDDSDDVMVVSARRQTSRKIYCPSQ